MKIIKLFPLFSIALSFVAAFVLYPYLPSTMITHWGSDGQPNGFSSRNFALLFMPILSFFLFLLFNYLPKTDPYKKNFKQFEKYFNIFINLVFLFLLYVYLLSLFYNLGYDFNMIQALSPAFATLFFYTGVLTANSKRNYFVGIRTPWTLSSDVVWNKTHILGGKLFKLTSFLSLLTLLIPQWGIYLIMVPLLLSTLIVYIYSYLIYRSL